VSAMNSLSWLIYAAEVVSNLKGVLVVAAIGSALVIGICSLVAGLNAEFGGEEGEWKKYIRYAWIVVAFALSAAVLPSTKTVYLIAASEAGEAVVTNPDAIEMMTDLKAIIKQRLKDELSK